MLKTLLNDKKYSSLIKKLKKSIRKSRKLCKYDVNQYGCCNKKPSVKKTIRCLESSKRRSSPCKYGEDVNGCCNKKPTQKYIKKCRRSRRTRDLASNKHIIKKIIKSMRKSRKPIDLKAEFNFNPIKYVKSKLKQRNEKINNTNEIKKFWINLLKQSNFFEDDFIHNLKNLKISKLVDIFTKNKDNIENSIKRYIYYTPDVNKQYVSYTYDTINLLQQKNKDGVKEKLFLLYAIKNKYNEDNEHNEDMIKNYKKIENLFKLCKDIQSKYNFDQQIQTVKFNLPIEFNSDPYYDGNSKP